MPNLNEILLDDITEQSVNLMRVEAGLAKKIEGALKRLELDIVNKINEIDPTSPTAPVYKLNRLNVLLKQVKDTIRSAYTSMRNVTAGDLTELTLSANVSTLAAINGAIGVDITTAAFPRSYAISLARKTPIQGAINSEWWSRQAGGLQKSFSDQMTLGILAGESNNDLVKRVRGSATGKKEIYWINDKKKVYTEFSGGLIDTGTRQAQALVRTAVQTVSQRARLDTYKENSHIIKGVYASVTFDLRTTDICKARSGMSWDLKTGEPLPGTNTTVPFPGAPPWHWNCRTQLIPVTKSWKELATKNKSKLGKSPKNMKASMDGQVPADQTYEQWLKKKPKEDQIKVLGPSKYELWKKGKITFRDLIDQSGNPLTVGELKAMS